MGEPHSFLPRAQHSARQLDTKKHCVCSLGESDPKTQRASGLQLLPGSQGSSR